MFARCALILFLGLAGAGLLPAQAPSNASPQGPPRCACCQTLLTGQFYWWESPTLPGKQALCEPCSKLETTCAVCKLPVRHHGRKLADGRWLCDRDYAAGVFSQAEALRIYETTWRDLQRILGSMPRQNVTVQLVDGLQLGKLNHALPSDHDDRSLLGLTRTRTFGNRQFQHQIYLLDGVGRARLAAISAHECTHTWLHENVPADRGLDRDTIEGFCELVAYKLMAERGEEIEKRIILANAYTRGQVNAFVQAEAEHHFHRIVKWVKTGQDEILTRTNSTRVLALRRDEAGLAPLTWPPPPPAVTPVPETVMLKGISGNATRRFALINDRTLTRNEQGVVRVGHTSILVRCLDIRERSALIRIEGVAQPHELFLGQEGLSLAPVQNPPGTVVRSDTP